MKPQIIEKLGIMLLNHGFVVKQLTQTCFDLIARKERSIFLLKVLEDANALSEVDAVEMMRVASYFGGSPLIIAEKASDPLEENVVYTRYGIFTLSPSTFSASLDAKMPFIKRSHAGLTAHIKGEVLREVREQHTLSLQAVSRRIGVSRRMILKYEEDGVEMTLSKALKMYDLFGHEVFDKIDVFHHKVPVPDAHASPVASKYVELGFEATEAKRAPFNVIAKQGKELILTGVGDKPNKHLQSLSQLINADNLVIFKKDKPKGIPAMTKRDFLEVERAGELVKFLHDEKYL
ncbi:MAG: helix-turn-helix domain-containing protein [Nanoarchaeota archaeon]